MSDAPAFTETPARDRPRASLLDVHLEFVSHRDNWLFLGLAVSIGAALVATDPRWRDLSMLALGWLLFIPQEYFTHVHLLHAPIPRSQRLYAWMYRLHYGHHDYPRRHDLMYMPMWLTLPMMVGNVLLLWALTPGARDFWAAFGGALLGYLVFEWSHLMCHVPYLPRSRLWRHVRTRHLLHHHQDEKRAYSVAPWTLFMDHLMGTRAQQEPGEAAPRSPSCRHLGLPADHAWIADARARFAARSNGNASGSRLWLRAGPGKG
jgi:hypothetical protein